MDESKKWNQSPAISLWIHGREESWLFDRALINSAMVFRHWNRSSGHGVLDDLLLSWKLEKRKTLSSVSLRSLVSDEALGEVYMDDALSYPWWIEMVWPPEEALNNDQQGALDFRSVV
ncbi:hypothetical protein U1Q18_004990 [Sarracenia purpurea var. burkii]